MSKCDTEKTCLAPLPVLLAIWGLLVVIALGSIYLVDHRAMQRMHQTASAATTLPTDQP